jgi:hypothetical protein
MTEPIDLALQRKVRAGDNLDMTPDELIRVVLMDLENGDYPHATKCMVMILETRPDGTMEQFAYRSGLTRSEEIGHLEAWKYERLMSWYNS